MDTTQARRAVQDGEDHWAWRPDWAAERACTFWYVAVPDGAVRLPALQEYVGALGRVPWLDAVPPRWWHLTLTEIGYVDQVDEVVLGVLGRAVAEAVAERGPLRLELGPVARLRTAVVLRAGAADELGELQAAVRAETERVLGHAVVHPKRFRPHASLAYVNRDVPAAEVDEVLGQAPPVEAVLEVDRLTLAAVTRRDRHYRWRVAGEVRLA